MKKLGQIAHGGEGKSESDPGTRLRVFRPRREIWDQLSHSTQDETGCSEKKERGGSGDRETRGGNDRSPEEDRADLDQG